MTLPLVKTAREWREEIVATMERAQITQRELAAIAKVTQPQLNRWLTGKTVPNLDSALAVAHGLLKLCAKLGVPRFPVG